MAPGCVQQVGNDLGEARVRQRRAHHAGQAVVQRRHGIEQVREAAGAALQRLHAVLVAAQGGPAARGSRRPQAGDRLHVARHFGRQGQQPDGRQRMQLLQLADRHRPRVVRLRAQLALVDVGPSRCMPRMRAAPGALARHSSPIGASAARRSSTGAVMVVASSAVVPCWACLRAACRAASPPSMMSRPAPPCTCRSMKPGSSRRRVRGRARLPRARP